MVIAVPNSIGDAGVAAQWSDTITNNDPFVTGDMPPIFTTDELVAASMTIPALTPVGFTAGALVPAVSVTTPAIGITVVAVTTIGGETTTRVAVYRGGCFNPDMINWPASYNTANLKKTAFDGAPAPTTIVIRAPRTMTPAAPV